MRPLVVGGDAITSASMRRRVTGACENLERAEGIVAEPVRRPARSAAPLEDNFSADHPAICHSSRIAPPIKAAVRMMSATSRARSFELTTNRPHCATRTAATIRPGLPAGAATGRTRRAVCGGLAQRRRRQELASAGTRTSRISTPSRALSGVLDPAWATLMTDLKSRGLLDSTLIVWMGEFGRTPKINGAQGRDHFPDAWTTVLAGGGIRGGQAIGRTSADGMTVEDRPVTVPDLLATVCRALGIDPMGQNRRTSAGRSALSSPRPRQSRRRWHEPEIACALTRGDGRTVRSQPGGGR